jgi:hypothetical protein
MAPRGIGLSAPLLPGVQRGATSTTRTDLMVNDGVRLLSVFVRFDRYRAWSQTGYSWQTGVAVDLTPDERSGSLSFRRIKPR